MKRILAIAGIVLLVALYVLTFIFALLSNNKAYEGFFKASVYMTFVVPVMLYVYMMFYKLLHKDDNKMDSDADNDDGEQI